MTKTRRITLSGTISWVVGGLCLVGGVGGLIGGSYTIALLLLLAAIVVFPPALDQLKKRFNIELSRAVKIGAFIGIMFVISMFLPRPNIQPAPVSSPTIGSTFQQPSPEPRFEAPSPSIEPTKVAFIEFYAKTSNWDSDAEDDGFLLELELFSNPFSMISTNGKVNITLYNDIGMTEPVKGKLLDSWLIELREEDFSTGTCGGNECGFTDKLRLEQHEKYKGSFFGTGVMRVELTTPDLQTFAAEDSVTLP